MVKTGLIDEDISKDTRNPNKTYYCVDPLIRAVAAKDCKFWGETAWEHYQVCRLAPMGAQYVASVKLKLKP